MQARPLDHSPLGDTTRVMQLEAGDAAVGSDRPAPHSTPTNRLLAGDGTPGGNRRAWPSACGVVAFAGVVVFVVVYCQVHCAALLRGVLVGFGAT